LRETQDGCDGCPGPFGGDRNRTAEEILGIQSTRAPRPQVDNRKVRPTFAGGQAFGVISDTKPKSLIPPQPQPNNNFVPNLAAAGLRTPAPKPVTPRPVSLAPRPVTPRPVALPPRPVTVTPKVLPSQPLTKQLPQQQFTFGMQQQQQPQRFPQQTQMTQSRFPQTNRIPQSTQQQNPRFLQQSAIRQQFGQQFGSQQRPQTNQQGPRQSTSGFSSQQLDIIRNGLSRLNGFGGFNRQGQRQQPGTQAQRPMPQQPRQPVQQQPRQQPVIQQQPRQPVQQPRQPVQQQPRQPVQQPRQPVQQPPRQPVQQPRQPVQQPPRQPDQQPRQQPAPAQPSTSAPRSGLSDLALSILKNAGVTNIPTSIPKVVRPKLNEPRVVSFLADETPSTNQGAIDDGRHFGPFQSVNLGNGPITSGPSPDLRAFPAIPRDGQFGPSGQDPSFGPFQVVDL
jgi:hypothetical protein